MEKPLEELILEETELRLSEMESSDYSFPPKADKMDAVGIVCGITISIVLIIMCMIGVIV